MKKNYSILSFALLLTFLTCFSKTKQIDSLKLLLQTTKIDTTKINILINISSKYIRINENDSVFKYANECLKLATKIHFKKGMGLAINNIAVHYNNKGDFKRAIIEYENAIKLFKEINNSTELGNIYNNIGIAYQSQGEFFFAMKNFLNALSINENNNDKNKTSNSYEYIGQVYFYLGNYSESLKNLYKSLLIKEELKDTIGIGNVYNVIAIINAEQHNYKEALKYFNNTLKINQHFKDKTSEAVTIVNMANLYSMLNNDREALNYAFKALKIATEIGNKSRLAAIYSTIGVINKKMGNYSEALKNHTIGLKLEEDIGDKNGIALSYSNLGIDYLCVKNIAQATYYLNLALLRSIAIKNINTIRDTYKNLVQLDSVTGDYKLGFEHYKLFVTYRDSLFNEESTKKTVQTQMQYEFDKKDVASKLEQEKVQAVTKAETKKQKIITLFTIGGLLIVSILALFIFNGLKKQRKANQIISRQKQEVEYQKLIVEEHQKEILDSIHYAKRIQIALLPNEKFIDKKLKSLKK